MERRGDDAGWFVTTSLCHRITRYQGRGMKSNTIRRTGRASRIRTYDLHNHVIPEPVVQAIQRRPERYGTHVEIRNGKRYFDSHGRMTELLPEFCDIEAKIGWVGRGGMGVSV